jgi:hypothetical protein
VSSQDSSNAPAASGNSSRAKTFSLHHGVSNLIPRRELNLNKVASDHPDFEYIRVETARGSFAWSKERLESGDFRVTEAIPRGASGKYLVQVGYSDGRLVQFMDALK